MDDSVLALERAVQKLGSESESFDIGDDTPAGSSVYSRCVYSDNVTNLDLYAPATSLAKLPNLPNGGPDSSHIPNYCAE